jgi:hypothetical protein
VNRAPLVTKKIYGTAGGRALPKGVSTTLSHSRKQSGREFHPPKVWEGCGHLAVAFSKQIVFQKVATEVAPYADTTFSFS